MKTLLQVAKVIRSKNAGPFELTLDIIFKDQPTYNQAKENNNITKSIIANLYKMPEENILSITWFKPANAVKITIKRPMASGEIGETDIYGAQQHAPLFALKM